MLNIYKGYGAEMVNLSSNDSKWIWYENSSVTVCGKSQHEMVYFRRKFDVQNHGCVLKVRISADSRYRLYCNGIAVASGPCKGNHWYTCYEYVDLSAYLRIGKNVIAAKVLHLADIHPYDWSTGGPTSIMRTGSGGFLLDGVLIGSDGNKIEDVGTDERWLAWKEQSITFLPPQRGYWASIFEHVDGSGYIHKWNEVDFVDSLWETPYIVTDSLFTQKPISSYGQTNGWDLRERSIPLLYEIDKLFLCMTKGSECFASGNKFLSGEEELDISPYSCCFMELDAGELTTGYLNLSLKGGEGSKIKIIYSECYESSLNGEYVKNIRNESGGILRGDEDILEPGGEELDWQTFWFRTFRFVRLEIVTSHSLLRLKKCTYTETGYPLNIEGEFTSSDSMSEKLWEISVRSLRRCMHETYEDCPYYEQLQYIMDTRLQALFTYCISKDDRLARKAIHDFHSSLTPEGLLQARYPSMMRQIIPGFALHWIFMLDDHFQYYGDFDLIKRYRPTMDAVLDWFDRKIDMQGLVSNTGYWSFVDWVQGWDQDSIPKANRRGPLTVYNLMYAAALHTAARLNEATGRRGVAEEYRMRAEGIVKQVRTSCWSEEKMLFTDGPGIDEYSQHTQVWAVLGDAISGIEAKKLMTRMLEADISKVSYAMSFYLFRALEAVGLYDNVNKLLGIWRELAKLNLTTWVEDPVTQRSDCHGWGAVPIYEFSAMTLGVRPAAPGFAKTVIKPHMAGLNHASGAVATRYGPIKVDWRICEKLFTIEVVGPVNLDITICMPDGIEASAVAGVYKGSCRL